MSQSRAVVHMVRGPTTNYADKVSRGKVLANRDLGLVFAKPTGLPFQQNNLGMREFARLIEASGVRLIKFHGMRHTCATLMLKNGENPKVVQERLGHANISITLDVYAHALPSMQREAADRIGALLHR